MRTRPTYDEASKDIRNSQGYAIFGHASWRLYIPGEVDVPTYTVPDNVYILMLSPGVSCYSDADRMFHRAISSDKGLLTKNDISTFHHYDNDFNKFKGACVLYTAGSKLPDLTVTMYGKGLKMGINKAILSTEKSGVGYEMKEILLSIKTKLVEEDSSMPLSKILEAIISEPERKPRQPILIGCSLCTIIRMPQYTPANVRALNALGMTQENQLGFLTDIGITGYGILKPSEEFQIHKNIEGAYVTPPSSPCKTSSDSSCVIMGGGRKTYKTRKHKRTRRGRTTPRKYGTDPRKRRR